jgi:hypothetical protein
MKGYVKDALFIIAVIAVVKMAKSKLPVPASVASLLP